MADSDTQNDNRTAKRAFGSGSTPSPGKLPAGAPAKLGRFELRAMLGEGAFGRVYRGYDAELRREVAIKVPHTSGLSDEFRERFLREARAIAAIHHPNVCPVFEVGTDGELPFIVMRFVAGTTLAHVIDNLKAPMPVRNAVMIARKLALGMAAAHAQGVTHRDLKPANILYETAAREVLITDFGLARVGGEMNLTAKDSFLGTPAYTSPEQANRKLEQVGPLSDVYSLGVILYEMLTGDVPFTGSVMEVAIAHCMTVPEPPSKKRPEIDSKLDAIVLKVMEKKPGDRYKSAREFSDVLTEYLRPGDSANAQSGSTPEMPLVALSGGREPEAAVETVAEQRSERRTAPTVEPPKPRSVNKPAPPPVVELDDEDEGANEADTEAARETRRSAARKTAKQSKAGKNKKRKEEQSPFAALLQNKIAWAGAALSVVALALLIVFLVRGNKPETVKKSANEETNTTNTANNTNTPPVVPAKVNPVTDPKINKNEPKVDPKELRLRNLLLGRWRITTGVTDLMSAADLAKWKEDKIYIYFEFKSDGVVNFGIDSFDAEVRIALAKDFRPIPLKYRATGADQIEFYDVPRGLQRAGLMKQGVQVNVRVDGDELIMKFPDTAKLIRVVLN